MPLPLVSIGIVTWNSAAHLSGCLEALALQRQVDFELVVVDNFSTDRSLDIVKQYFPDVKIIRNDTNTGFCHAHNQAIQASHGDYYLPLNPDVEMERGYIAGLLGALEARPEYGSAAGKLLQSPGWLDSTGLFINRRRQQYLRGHGEPDRGQYDAPGEVFGVDGAAPLYRRQMIDAIQFEGEFFDESFFAHKEDVDVAWRAQILGWRCWYTPEAMALHPRSFRPGQRKDIAPIVRVHAVKNRFLLLAKNESSAGWRRDGARILFYDLQILVYLLFFERSSLRAIGLIRRCWSRTQQWHRRIWLAETRPAQEILEWFQ
jgi:GT2 family glycosyltransferase